VGDHVRLAAFVIDKLLEVVVVGEHVIWRGAHGATLSHGRLPLLPVCDRSGLTAATGVLPVSEKAGVARRRSFAHLQALACLC
jgi:hypothetical protein